MTASILLVDSDGLSRGVAAVGRQDGDLDVRRDDRRRQLDDVVERDSGLRDPVEVVAVRSGRNPDLGDNPVALLADGQGLANPDPGDPGNAAEVEDQVLWPARSISESRRPSYKY